jgi:CheY-like chemotaxis protein
MITRRILLVSADVSFIVSMEQYLAEVRPAWELTRASGGLAALVLQASVPAHAVVADLDLPDINGFSLLQEILKRHPNTLRFVEAIALHHYPSRLFSKSLSILALTHVANAVAHETETDQSWSGLSGMDMRYLEALGVGPRVSHWRRVCIGTNPVVT